MTVPPSFNRQGPEAAGFTGFIPFDEVPAAPTPASPGVYAVVRDPDVPPEYLDCSVAGRFKGRNPTVGSVVLARKWVDTATVVYIGKATSLSGRLRAYASIGRGNPVGHWGGRYVWQLADHDRLLVAWLALPHGTDPFDAEHALLDAFTAEYGALPFANIRRGRTPRSL